MECIPFDFEYSIGEMAATRPAEEEVLFWLAKVREVHKNDRGQIAELSVHLHRPSGIRKNSPFEASYVPCMIREGRGRLRRSKLCVEKFLLAQCMYRSKS